MVLVEKKETQKISGEGRGGGINENDCLRTLMIVYQLICLDANHHNSSFHLTLVFYQRDIVSPKLKKKFRSFSERFRDKFFWPSHILYMQSVLIWLHSNFIWTSNKVDMYSLQNICF